MIIFSFLCLAFYMMLVFYIVRRRPAVLIGSFFILFPLIYRSIDITYLDIFGPVYAREVNRFVGGNFAAPMFIYSALALTIPLLLLFPDRPAKLRALSATPASYGAYHRNLSHFALAAFLGMLGVLMANFTVVGSIPILQGIDRLEYERSAGIIHSGFYELNFLINFALGAFTVMPRLNGRDFDLRFGVIAFALMAYWVITGNRFSAFFVLVSFYLLPLAAVIMAQRSGRISPDSFRSSFQRVLSSRSARIAAILFGILMVGGLVFNSYYNVRDYREPLVEIQERILVQPVQLWANAWERVDYDTVGEPLNDHAVREILNPIDPSRNSTIQYLMTLELGFFRSAELTEAEQAYNGGYPEVHFELFGGWLPLLTLPIVGLIGAGFLSLCVTQLYRNHVMTAILGIYLFFGISLHFTSGMMTFLLAPTYWLKIAAFLITWTVESQLVGRQTGAPAGMGQPHSRLTVRAGFPVRR